MKNSRNGSFNIMSAVVLQSALNELPIVIVFGMLLQRAFLSPSFNRCNIISFVMLISLFKVETTGLRNSELRPYLLIQLIPLGQVKISKDFSWRFQLKVWYKCVDSVVCFRVYRVLGYMNIWQLSTVIFSSIQNSKAYQTRRRLRLVPSGRRRRGFFLVLNHICLQCVREKSKATPQNI